MALGLALEGAINATPETIWSHLTDNAQRSPAAWAA